MALENEQSERLTLQQIVMCQLKSIAELSSKYELQSGSNKVTVVDNQKTTTSTEDLRVRYYQSIENLAYLLYPHFDKKMLEFFDKEIIFLKGMAFEIIPQIKDEGFKKRITEATGEDKDNLVVFFQMRKSKDMLIELNSFLKRIEYLKTNIFGNTLDDDIIIENGGGTDGKISR